MTTQKRRSTAAAAAAPQVALRWINKITHVSCGGGGGGGGTGDGKYVFCEIIVACYLQRSSFIAAVFVRKLFCLRFDNESESTSAAYM